MILLALAAGFFLGWNIGANAAGICIAPTFGSGIMGYRRAIIIAAVFMLLGALLNGSQVMDTVGKGIITSEVGAGTVLISLTVAGVFLLLATLCSLPVSTAQVMIGAITGIGLAMSIKMDHGKLMHIIGSWVICPPLTMMLSFLIYIGLAAVFGRIKNQQKAYLYSGKLMLLSSCYLAFSLGANNVGNATGFLFNLERFNKSVWVLLVIGGCSMAIGGLTFGKRVTMTVGKSITPLNIPVSLSQAMVGSVLGVGLVKGARAVSKRTLAEIGVGWVATPLLSALFAFIACKLLMRV